MYKYFVRKTHNLQQFNNIYNSQEILIVEKNSKASNNYLKKK